MAYVLGISPDALEVFLYRDADFDSVLTRTDDDGVALDWGTDDVRLVFPGALADPDNALAGFVSWPSTVTDSEARFQVDKVLTNQRAHKDLVELWVGDQCWATGKVAKGGTKGVIA